MRTVRSLISERGEVFFHWKSWELWEAQFQREASFFSLKIMRTMRSMISKRRQISFHCKSWELWEAWIQRGTSFLFLKIMRTMRRMNSKRGQVFFYWNSWELWEAWFQRKEEVLFHIAHENHEKPDSNAQVRSYHASGWNDKFSCSHASGPGYQVFTENLLSCTAEEVPVFQ